MTSTSAGDDEGTGRVYCHFVRRRNTASRAIDLHGWTPGDGLEVLDEPAEAPPSGEPVLHLLGTDPGIGEVDYCQVADDPIGSANLWRAIVNL